MGVDRRTFIVSNLHRDEASDINNDVTITLPDSIFSGKIETINLRHLFIDFDFETIGTSNYEFYITYPSTSLPVLVTLDINKGDSTIVKTDYDLVALIASSINSTIGTTAFQVYNSSVVIYYQDVYRDNSDLLSNYTIFTDNGVEFILDFTSKHSLGPLLGFGNNVYSGASSYRGGNIPPIYAYESIKVSNKAYDTTFKEYDQYSDIACKMDLYDSDDNLITNYLDARDATISLPIVDGYIHSIREFIKYLEVEMNRYSENFSPPTIFSINYSYDTNKFTIENDKNLRFGIGFRFDRNGTNNYGSLHRHLGFNKSIYLGMRSFTSISTAAIFDKAYIAEYLFICSDLIKYNYDASIIVSESQGKATFYESLFAIPMNQIINGSYTPNFEEEHKVRIHASMFAKKYNENLNLPKTINFYLKTSSGRHIKLNTQWSLKFDIEYNN